MTVARLGLLFGCAGLMLSGAGAARIATASVDLGNEWLKIGLVKPGVPMDIVLNAESQRKTNVLMSLRDGERTFSDPAMVNAIKYPKNAFRFLTELLGQQVESVAVQRYQERFPFHTITPHPDRGTVVFQTENGGNATVEELLAQVVTHAVDNAASFAEQEISSIVLTVPPYFTQAQRKAMLLVGKIAGIKVTQLLNANTAVAINYGVFRTKTFNETAQNILFYDMGASSTVATIASYTSAIDKSVSKLKPTPSVEIKSVAYDRTLGGVEWDYRLRDILLERFLENKKVASRADEVRGNHRAMAKLFAAAQKVKKVLSANKDTKAQVEGLFDEIDFKAPISREDFEEATADLFARVARPIEDALKFAGMQASHIDQIILFGGGLRIPKVQEILKETMGVEQLGKSINGDEAACLGASYRAAELSKAFRLTKFVVRDANLFPVEVRFNRTEEDDEGVPTGEITPKTKTIYDKFTDFPKKRKLSFNRFHSDFGFTLNYGNLDHLDADEVAALGPLDIAAFNLTGVSEAFEANAGTEEKGVKVHFSMDANGLVEVSKAEAVFEKEVEPEQESESILDSVSSMIWGSEGETGTGEAKGEGGESDAPVGEDKPEEEGQPEKEEETTGQPEKEEAEAGQPEKEEDEAGQPEKDEVEAGQPEGKGEDGEGEEGTADKDAENATSAAPESVPEPPPPPKPIEIKAGLEVSSVALDIAEPSPEEYDAALERIAEIVAAEADRRAREESFNVLEGLVYSSREFLESDEAGAVLNETQREAIEHNLTRVGDWLEEDAWEANTSTLKKWVRRTEHTMRDVQYRAAEAAARPDAVAKLRRTLKVTAEAILRVRNFTAHQPENASVWITEKEIDELQTIANDTETWLDERAATQAELEGHEAPVLKTSVIETKTQRLERELNYILKKPKPRPKVVKPPKAKKSKAKAKADEDVNGTTIDGGDNETVVDGSADGEGDDGATTVEPGTTDGAEPVEEPPAGDGGDGEDGEETPPATDGDEKDEL